MLALFVLAPALVTGLAQVSIEGFAFVPESVYVQPGDTVRWTNNDDVVHTSTSVNAAAGLWNSGNMGLNKTYQYVFKKEGVFDYHCTPHSGMLGWVAVSTVVPVLPAAHLSRPKPEKTEGPLRDLRGRALEADRIPKSAAPAFQKYRE